MVGRCVVAQKDVLVALEDVWFSECDDSVRHVGSWELYGGSWAIRWLKIQVQNTNKSSVNPAP
jgi:hypothetical protein